MNRRRAAGGRPRGTRRLSWPRSAGVNPLAPLPSTAVRNVLPSVEVSTVYSRVLDEAPSPQPAVGSMRNDVTSTVSGSRSITVGGPACGFPGFSLVGLNEDQTVACD